MSIVLEPGARKTDIDGETESIHDAPVAIASRRLHIAARSALRPFTRGGRALATHPRATGGAALGLLWAFFLATGFLGLDFGRHWDEWYQLAGLRDCLDKMTWLPQRHVYGGLYFALGIPALLRHLRPHLVPALRASAAASTVTLDPATLPEVQHLQEAARTALDDPTFLLIDRATFLIVASTAIGAVYFACRRLQPTRPLVAVAAAAFLALSWELQYHARVVAVDAPLTAAVALQLALVAAATTATEPRQQTRLVMGAALAGGLALGFKATAVFNLLPTLVCPWVVPGPRGFGSRLRLTLGALVVFSLTVFASSPASFLDPLRAIATMSYARRDYGENAAAHNNAVTGYWDHARRLVTWLAAAVPSPSPTRSLAASAVAGFGLFAVCRRHRRFALAWLPAAAIFVAFMLFAKLLVVRQYLPLLPPFAVCFGMGVDASFRFLTRPGLPRGARAALAFALAAALVLNGRWLYDSAQSIRKTTAQTLRDGFFAELLARRAAVLVSPALHEALKEPFERHFKCEPASAASSAPQIAFKYTEQCGWKGNRLGVRDQTFAPRDFNYDWYVAFPGKLLDERIMNVGPAFARSIELDTKAFLECVPL